MYKVISKRRNCSQTWHVTTGYGETENLGDMGGQGGCRHENRGGNLEQFEETEAAMVDYLDKGHVEVSALQLFYQPVFMRNQSSKYDNRRVLLSSERTILARHIF